MGYGIQLIFSGQPRTKSAMSTRSKSRKTPLRRDKRTGQYLAKLGRKKTKTGKIDGHLFRFSTNERESERRKVRIQELWDYAVETLGDTEWNELTLHIAKSFANGETSVSIPMVMITTPSGEPHMGHRFDYVTTLEKFRKIFPFVHFVPEDEDAYELGSLEVASISEGLMEEARFFAQSSGGHDPTEATVGEALDAFESEHIRKRMLVDPDPEEGLSEKRLSDTAQKYIAALERIRQFNGHQLNWPLSKLTYDGCEAMIEVWRQRPPRKDGTGPLAIKTCREHAKRIKEFFRWLSKSDRFDWQKPIDFDELKLAIQKSNKDKSAPVTLRAQQVRTFTVDQLKTLNEFAIPFERFLLLCGLNLGFKRMECATLRVGEILLRQKHPYSEYIAFDFSDTDSFVSRIRTKTEVYGEWLLWPLTEQAMEWVLERRKKQTRILKGDGKGREISYGPTSLALLNDSGHSFTKPTKSGNPNHQLTNMWYRLLDRIQEAESNFPRLPHETLRDTSANWIREEFGGEIAEVFLAHGSPLGSKSLVECYSNKPFGKVFTALQWLQEKLKPVFDSTPDNPFPVERKLGGGGLNVRQIKQIRRLAELGLSVPEIAEKVGCSKMSIYRHRENGTAPR